MKPEDMLITCLHEVIHAFMTFPPDTEQARTSRLCAKNQAGRLSNREDSAEQHLQKSGLHYAHEDLICG